MTIAGEVTKSLNMIITDIPEIEFSLKARIRILIKKLGLDA